MPKVSEEHLEARRRQILVAAVACFAREGVHQTTMQDVFRESGLSPGAVYRYFASKADLIEAIAAEVLRMARDAVGATGADPEAPEDLWRAFEDLFDAFEDFELGEAGQRRRVALHVWGEALRNPRVKELVVHTSAQIRSTLAERVRQAQERSVLDRGLDPDSAARAVVALFQGLVVQSAWEELDREVYRAAAAALLRGAGERGPRRRSAVAAAGGR